MPNYCENTLILKATTRERLETFYNENCDSAKQMLSFNKIVPVFENNGDILNNGDCCELWGTKWDAIDPSVRYNPLEKEPPYTMTYDFYTAWSPPLGWLYDASLSNPDIDFEIEFKEAGCDFWGKRIYTAGIVSHEESDHLSDHNWNICNQKLLEDIVNRNMFYITPENYTMKIEGIIEDFAFETEYYDNLDSYVEKLIIERLEQKQKQKQKHQYNG